MARLTLGTRREISKAGAVGQCILFSKSDFVRGSEYLTPELHPAVARPPAYHIVASSFWLNLPSVRLIFRAWGPAEAGGKSVRFPWRGKGCVDPECGWCTARCLFLPRILVYLRSG